MIFLSFINSRDIGSDSMKIDNNTLNEIRNNLDIVDIISNYLLVGMVEAVIMIHPLVYKVFKLPYANYKNYNLGLSN